MPLSRFSPQLLSRAKALGTVGTALPNSPFRRTITPPPVFRTDTDAIESPSMAPGAQNSTGVLTSSSPSSIRLGSCRELFYRVLAITCSVPTRGICLMVF